MTKRPTKLDKEVLEPAMKELYEKQIKGTEFDESKPEDTIASLVRSYAADAYQFGKNLDYDGWSVDMPLCERLDCSWAIVDRHYKAALEKWYKENPITPYKIGSEVIVTKVLSTIKGRNCIVISVKEKTGEYVVCEKEKHKEGITCGYVLNHEDLQLVNG